jgi:hypothetical protein
MRCFLRVLESFLLFDSFGSVLWKVSLPAFQQTLKYASFEVVLVISSESFPEMLNKPRHRVCNFCRRPGTVLHSNSRLVRKQRCGIRGLGDGKLATRYIA